MYRAALIASVILLSVGIVLVFFESRFSWLCFAMLAVLWIYNYIKTSGLLMQLAHQPGVKPSRNPSLNIRTLYERLNNSENQLVEMIHVLAKIGVGEKVADTGNLKGEAKASVLSLQLKLGDLKEGEVKRMWASEGLARINEIRKKQNSLEEYAYDAICTLVKYLNANQGCFYLLNEIDKGEEELHLLATYAYNKKRITDKSMQAELRTGLLSQSVLEKDMIFIKAAPKDYVKITSGLGEALPRCITIMPLMFREKVYGVIEMASFEVLEQHQLDFVRTVSETIASEMSGMRASVQTKKLLEQAQHQANELRSQEEELRQNMEEMQATGEAMRRKEIELQKKLKEVETERMNNLAILNGCMDGVISFTDGGEIVFANTVANEIFGLSQQAVIGRQIGSLLQLHIHENGQGKKILNRTGNEINIRTEVMAENVKGEELSLLLTATKVSVEGKLLFTIFIQKISVDLF